MQAELPASREQPAKSQVAVESSENIKSKCINCTFLLHFLRPRRIIDEGVQERSRSKKEHDDETHGLQGHRYRERERQAVAAARLI
jgi:hypothetical protein